MPPTKQRRCGIALATILVALVCPAQERPELSPQAIASAPRIDGHLDEAEWSTAPVARDFVQQRPQEGDAASAFTEVRLLYDQHALYLGFVCHDADPSGLVRQRLGRDASIASDDHFAFVLDTFLDLQNGYYFAVNPNGVRYDLQFRAEGTWQAEEWDGIWSAAVLTTATGWQGEIAIPWRSLRFPRSDEIAMGLNFQRQQRRLNEQSHWSAIPRPYSLMRVANAGRIRGLRSIQPGRNLLLRPYALGRLARGEENDFATDDWDAFGDVGFDLRAGLGPELTADITVNTDFAQVESDDQQVNLTRFPLEFPEKREFFLEKRDLFVFGSPGNAPFFSRRIGLDDEHRTVPIEFGTRLTGKVGRTDFGLLTMSTSSSDGTPGRRFDVARLSRDFGARSRVGVIGVQRDSDGDAEPINRTLGLDLDLRPTEQLDIAAFAAVVDQESLGGDDHTLAARARWTESQYNISYYHESIGRDYAPAAGFVIRPNVDEDSFGWSWTPEPNGRWIRRYENHGQFQFISRRFDKADSESGFESRFIHVHPLAIGHHDEELGVYYNSYFERLYEPFDLGDGLMFPGGDYDFSTLGANFNTDPGRMFSLSCHAEIGDFFDGTRRSIDGELSARWAPHLSAGIAWNDNHIERGDTAIDRDLLRLRMGYAFSNQLRTDLLTQWNSRDERWASQLRVHFLFGDESDLYLVFNELRRDSSDDLAPLRSETVVKLAYALSL